MTSAVGGAGPVDPSVTGAFEAALVRIRQACADNGIAAGLHTRSGEEAAKQISEGFTLLTVAGDIPLGSGGAGPPRRGPRQA